MCALNDRLKDINKSLNKRSKKKIEFIKTNKKKSKFLDKYEERMNSIKECDSKTKKKQSKANQILSGAMKQGSKKVGTNKTSTQTTKRSATRTGKTTASRTSTARNVAKDDTLKMQFVNATKSKKD